MIFRRLQFLTLFVMLLLLGALSMRAQSAGTIRGSVLDPSGAAIKGATVQIQNPVSHYSQSTQTDGQGNFEFANIPYNPYHASAAAPGFQGAEQDVDVRSPIPVELKISLAIGTSTESVTVVAAGDLIETDSTSHTDVDRELFDKLPLESQSSSLSSLVTLASPGVAADSNGLFHGLGDHASNSFSIDGQPITDQQSKVFSNQLPVDAVQSMEVIEGAPPAEYGGKTSLVIVVTTRSGLGSDAAARRHNGFLRQLRHLQRGFDLAYGGKSWGNFISASGMNTSRFLDGPEFTVMHDHGNRGECFRPGGLQAFLKGHDQLEFRLHAVLVPDAEFLRCPECDGVVRAGLRQLSELFDRLQRPRSQRPAGRVAGSAFEDQNL